jgi:hypothetical protein
MIDAGTQYEDILNSSQTWNSEPYNTLGPKTHYAPCSISKHYNVLPCAGRRLETGWSPIQGVLQKRLKGSIITAANFESEKARGPNPRNVYLDHYAFR